ESRLGQAVAWAGALELVKEVSEGNQTRLEITSKGQRWLSSHVDEQYKKIYDLLRNPAARSDLYSLDRRFFDHGWDWFSSTETTDMRFLGTNVAVLKVKKGRHHPSYWDAKPEDYQALRQSLDQAFSVLKPGVFYRLDQVGAHLVFREHNPLNLGLA